MISFAYKDKPNLTTAKNAESIDLISSGVSVVVLENYPNLKRLRISKCDFLKEVHISHMPNLQVVDLLNNDHLKTVTFDDCPNLVTLDAGYCSNLTKLTGINSLEYLSIPCSFSVELEPTPNIVFLDITGIRNVDIKRIISECKQLECLVCSPNDYLKLSEITKNHSLKIIHVSAIICDSIDQGTQLKIIIFDFCHNYEDFVKGDINLLDNFYVTDQYNTNKDLNDFKMFDNEVFKYRSYQKMLYGPWGIPDIDRLAPLKINKPVITPPAKINQEKAADAIIGSIFASAVLDMIGVGVEFLTNGVTKGLLVGNPDITWSHPRCNDHNERFVRGTPTDDTSQTILIMRSIVEANYSGKKGKICVDGVNIDPVDFGKKLVDWIYNGHQEHKHKGGLGCGATTFSVIKHPLYKSDPIKAAYEVWDQTGRRVAPNGSVMRIASSGAFAFWDENVVIQNASYYARVTHADPRCVFSSIGAALLIARYIQWNSGFIDNEPDIDKTIQDAINLVPELESYQSDVTYYMSCEKVEDLKLAENKKIGYCLKAFGSAVWALKKCGSIEEGLKYVIREGGDSDTNGAVVGALLGAKYGFKGIPKEYVTYMFVGQWLYREISPYMELMGIKMPPSPYQ